MSESRLSPRLSRFSRKPWSVSVRGFVPDAALCQPSVSLAVPFSLGPPSDKNILASQMPNSKSFVFNGLLHFTMTQSVKSDKNWCQKMSLLVAFLDSLGLFPLEALFPTLHYASLRFLLSSRFLSVRPALPAYALEAHENPPDADGRIPLALALETGVTLPYLILPMSHCLRHI